MDKFTLNKKLEDDSHMLGTLGTSYLLLMRNAHFPWFVIVPLTDKTEFHALDHDQQLILLEQINGLSQFIEDNFSIDKLNIACIGNVVSQLHIHIVGRRTDDICWPNVVWGIKEKKAYTESDISAIKEKLKSVLDRL